MANRTIKILGFVMVALAFSVVGWAQRGPGWGVRGGGDGAGDCSGLLSTLPMEDVDTTETAGLIYMREEEKLARDVYATLYAKWGVRIFSTISQSEENHTGAIKLLLDRYGIPDPIADPAVGTFSDPNLKDLYSNLVAAAQGSLAAAMRTGAIIEDLDIRDLDSALSATDNQDLKVVYGNLRRASGNHLRAFVSQLEALGEGPYTATYITAETLAEILAAPSQGGPGNGPRGMGRGTGVCPFATVAPSSSNGGSGRK